MRRYCSWCGAGYEAPDLGMGLSVREEVTANLPEPATVVVWEWDQIKAKANFNKGPLHRCERRERRCRG